MTGKVLYIVGLLVAVLVVSANKCNYDKDKVIKIVGEYPYSAVYKMDTDYQVFHNKKSLELIEYTFSEFPGEKAVVVSRDKKKKLCSNARITDMGYLLCDGGKYKDTDYQIPENYRD